MTHHILSSLPPTFLPQRGHSVRSCWIFLHLGALLQRGEGGSEAAHGARLGVRVISLLLPALCGTPVLAPPYGCTDRVQ